MKHLFTTILSFFISVSFAQDIRYARKMVDTLASPYFWGRGYTKDGMQKAADFIVKEFKNCGLKPLRGNSYLQDYSYPVNTFPGKMRIRLNGKKLNPGADFIIGPESRGAKGKYTLIEKDSTHFTNAEKDIIISLEKKLKWSVSQKVANYTVVQLDKNRVKEKPHIIKLNIENKLIDNYKASNICGMVKGTQKPDSVILLTAHYDHLGGMGKDTYFPGANDNASGVSLLLNLAKYYSAHPQPYTIAFICFSGEEAGLTGSKYFTENPLFDLQRIRFLLNMDLTGTGDEGITVVNGTEFKKEFSLLSDINNAMHYLPKVSSRGKSANSDHYWFFQKKVPSFFIYTNGGVKAYHDIYDEASTLPLTAYEKLFKLLVDFNSKLMNAQ